MYEKLNAHLEMVEVIRAEYARVRRDARYYDYHYYGRYRVAAIDLECAYVLELLRFDSLEDVNKALLSVMRPGKPHLVQTIANGLLKKYGNQHSKESIRSVWRSSYVTLRGLVPDSTRDLRWDACVEGLLDDLEDAGLVRRSRHERTSATVFVRMTEELHRQEQEQARRQAERQAWRAKQAARREAVVEAFDKHGYSLRHADDDAHVELSVACAEKLLQLLQLTEKSSNLLELYLCKELDACKEE